MHKYITLTQVGPHVLPEGVSEDHGLVLDPQLLRPHRLPFREQAVIRFAAAAAAAFACRRSTRADFGAGSGGIALLRTVTTKTRTDVRT